MNTTLGDTHASGDRAARSPCWWYLTIAHHADASLRGERCTLSDGGVIEIVRDGETFRRGVLADSRLSRRHCRFSVEADGSLVVEDLQSRNGTLVNGAKIDRHTLVPRDVVRFGSSLCVVQRLDRPLMRTKSAYATISPVLQSLLLDLEHLGANDRCVVFRGEPHCDVERLIAVHEGTEPMVFDVRGATARSVETFVAKSSESPVFFPLWPPADASIAKTIVGALAMVEPRRRAYFVWLRDGHEADPLGDEFRRALSPLVFAVPAMRDRSEDVLAFVEQFARQHHGAPARFDSVLATALLRAEWPSNLVSLEQFARVYLRPAEQGSVLGWRDEFAPVLGVQPAARDDKTPAKPAAETPASATAPRFRVAADGRWFEGPGGERVDLAMRFALARVLRALVEQHRHDPERYCSVDALVASGWPGERPVADTGSNRVYVAITTLRKLGLRALIERGEDGYRFARNESCEVVASTSR